jgi:hypothetical protein
VRFVPPLSDPTDLVIQGGVLALLPRAITATPALVPVDPMNVETVAPIPAEPSYFGLPEPQMLPPRALAQDAEGAVPLLNLVVGHYLTPVPFGPPRCTLPSIGSTTLWVIAGQTLDSSGSPLPSCRVVVLQWGRLVVGEAPVIADVVSSAIDGSFSIPVPGDGEYQAIAYLEGSPDLAGITLHPLTPTRA